MIINGPILLLAPQRVWTTRVSVGKPPMWLLGAGLTAAVIPAVAVVGGHLGAAALGHQQDQLALQRAAVGLFAVVCGAVLMAPALTLALMKISQNARAAMDARSASTAAMGLIWPAWATGLVLAVPPLVGLGPETGELAWTGLAFGAMFYVVKKGALPGVGVTRRWAGVFTLQTAVTFFVLFVTIVIVPAAMLRSAVGAQSKFTYESVPPIQWPTPPQADW